MKNYIVIFILSFFFCVSCTLNNKNGNSTGDKSDKDSLMSLQNGSALGVDSLTLGSDGDSAAVYFGQLMQKISEHPHDYVAFGDFEKKHFLLNESSICPGVYQCTKMGNFYSFVYLDGDDCERYIHYLIVDGRFNITDTMTVFVGGCEAELSESEIFASDEVGSHYHKDTIGEYCYFGLSHLPKLKLTEEFLSFSESTTYTVKNIPTGEFMYVDFADTTIYSVDASGRLQVVREAFDTFSEDRMLERMKQ